MRKMSTGAEDTHNEYFANSIRAITDSDGLKSKSNGNGLTIISPMSETQ